VQRQWIGLSKSGDEVSVEPLHHPSYLQSLDLEVGFLRPRHEVSEVYSADEMTRNFLKAFSNILFTVDEIVVFEFHGQNLKATVKGVSVLELADGQRGAPRSQQAQTHFGILMDKTDITFMKAGDSLIKLKSSAKKYVLHL
jgi:vesicle-fusing ATPase